MREQDVRGDKWARRQMDEGTVDETSAAAAAAAETPAARGRTRASRVRVLTSFSGAYTKLD